MSDKPVNVKAIGQFGGFASNRDPHEQPEIAVEATNMVFHEPGILACRKGSHTLESFADNTGSGTAQVISAFAYKRAGKSYIIHQDSNGLIKAGRLQ